MNGASPPRRAVLAADRHNGTRRFGLSRGWQGEAAAADAVRLLSTEGASVQIADFAGFFTLRSGSWAIVRGGLASPPNPAGRYWREAVVLEDRDFARIRYNAFRALPRLEPDILETSTHLRPPVLPTAIPAGDDLMCVGELYEYARANRRPEEIETLVAAVLESEHTLVTGSQWSYGDLELITLLLPPRLRKELTFHTCALSMPREPIPRLVLTPLDDHWSFQPESGVWGHRLPLTRHEISTRTREVASDLIGLLEVADRLTEAHEAYEEYVTRYTPEPRPLLDEVETLLRFARLSVARGQGEVGAALRILGRAAGAHAGDLDQPELACLVELIREGFPLDSIAASVAQAIRHSQLDPAVPAFLMERFLRQRSSDTSAFAAFADRLSDASVTGALAADEEGWRSVRTMLVLMVAAGGDAAAMAAAARPPLDRGVIERLGGVGAWTPADGALGMALRALVEAQSPDGTVEALRAVARLRSEIAPGKGQLHLVELGLACMRWAYQRLPASAWQAGVPISIAGLGLWQSVSASGRVALHGDWENDPFQAMLDRSAAADRDLGLESMTDVEVFLGFLGVDAARSRPAVWELAERGEALVNEMLRRIDRDAGRDSSVHEGVHWAMALMDRIRRQEIDVQYVRLATKLLHLSAGVDARNLMRSYLEANADLATRLRENLASATDVFGDRRRPSVQPNEEEEEVPPLATPSLGWAPVLEDEPETWPALDLGSREEDDAAAVAGRDDDDMELRSRMRELWRTELESDSVDDEHSAFSRASGLVGPIDAVEKPRRGRLQLWQPESDTEATPDHQPPIVREPDEEPRRRRRRELRPSTPDPDLVRNRNRHEVAAELARRRRRAPPPSVLRSPVRPRRVAALLAVAGGLAILAVLGWIAIQGLPAIGFGFGTGQVSGRSVDAAVARLAEAKIRAASGQWGRVVELLRPQPPERVTAIAFAWDSLLARGAIQQAKALPSEDTGRTALLNLARERATRALATVGSFGRGTAELRLLRAEACIAGQLDCDGLAVMEDLVFAQTSTSRTVYERARTLQASWNR